jgi:hypothetical protein
MRPPHRFELRQQAARLAFEQRFRADALKSLYEYWQELRQGRSAPSRAEIDLLRIKSILPNIILLDVEDNPRRYNLRLMGTRIVSWYGSDATGCYVDEIDFGGSPMSTFTTLDQLVDKVVPAHMTGEYDKHDGRHIRYERLMLPMSSDGKRVDKILGAAYRLPPDAPIMGDSLDL